VKRHLWQLPFHSLLRHSVPSHYIPFTLIPTYWSRGWITAAPASNRRQSDYWKYCNPWGSREWPLRSPKVGNDRDATIGWIEVSSRCGCITSWSPSLGGKSPCTFICQPVISYPCSGRRCFRGTFSGMLITFQSALMMLIWSAVSWSMLRNDHWNKEWETGIVSHSIFR